MSEAPPPCYIKAKDVWFVSKYLGLDYHTCTKLTNWAKVETMNWPHNWRKVVGCSFYIEKSIEEWIAWYCRPRS
jgi:hypothetical protein